MQASRKLRKRCPCQKLLVSVGGVAAALLVSLSCSTISASVAVTTLRAVVPQISQVLMKKKKQHADFRNEIAKIKYHDSSRHAVDTNPRFIGRANFLWKLSSLDKKLKVNPMKRKRRKQ